MSVRNRLFWPVVFLAAISFFLAAPPTRAQDASFWTFLKEGRVVTRCVNSSAAHHEARTRLERLDERVRTLENTDPVIDVVGELHGLLKTECFLTAAETDRIPTPDTVLSLKDWWIDGGGYNWLASFLELPRLGPMDSPTPHVVVPADARKTLNLDAHRNHPLNALLCPLGDTACATETRGWKLRAEKYFDLHHEAARHAGPEIGDERVPSSPSEIAQQCAEKAPRSEGERYQQWRACIETHRPLGVALPLGEFKRPMTGWLVMSGRRGHYEFCDTTRAYNLADGAAFIHDSCSALVLKPGGHVDRDATNKGRVEHLKAGTIPVDNLREAVWMLLLRGEAEEVQLRAEYYPLPAGLTPSVTVGAGGHEVVVSGMWSNTAQTQLTWWWRPDDGPAFVGELTWPDSYQAAESHAASLLAIAEEAFADRCVAGPLPRVTSRGVRNLNEVPADAIRDLNRAFQRASERWKTLTACRSGAR